MRFCFVGYINARNIRCYSAKNPLEFVRCVMSRSGIIGPKFFEETNSTKISNNIVTGFVQELENDELQDRFSQHDGATTHTVGDNLSFLHEFFDHRVISLHSVPYYPPTSPDLTPLDYFLFGHLKNTIFKTPFHTIED